MNTASNNPYYPYQKVADYTTLPDAEKLLKKIVEATIKCGYMPVRLVHLNH